MPVSSFIKNLFGIFDEAKYFILKTKDLPTILKISPLDSALTVGTFYTLTLLIFFYSSKRFIAERPVKLINKKKGIEIFLGISRKCGILTASCGDGAFKHTRPRILRTVGFRTAGSYASANASFPPYPPIDKEPTK